MDQSATLEVIQDPECPPVILTRLAARYHEDPGMAIYALQHPNMPPKILERYAYSDREDIVCAVASNPACPGSVLAVLYDREYEEMGFVIRASILANPSYAQ